jgi:putative ABC transport system permease protein
MSAVVKIAFRNLRRNARRSFMTMSAIAVGAAAMLCFGQFIAETILEFQTGVVRQNGHISIFHAGYFDFGAGNPAAYGISGYPSVIRLIGNDPVLKPLIRVVTPTISMFGIAGNYGVDASTTFSGSGYVPADLRKMGSWDRYGLFRGWPPIPIGITDSDESAGVIGVGIARILGECAALHVANCPTPPRVADVAPAAGAAPPDFVELAKRDMASVAPAHHGAPRLDLLTATSQGAPNVASFFVVGAESQGIRAIDDSYVRMHFNLARRLLYGRNSTEATAIVLQLNNTADLALAQGRLQFLLKSRHLNLETRDFTQLNPFYAQGEQFLGAIFIFIASIMAVIVLFTVVNTTSMAVLERTNEIGTARAIGVQRSTIRWQFALEGSLLGGIGATAGLVMAQLIGLFLNALHISITMPGSAQPSRLILLTSSTAAPLMIGVWLVLVVVAIMAAWVPANQAARMPIVDALRHV